MKSFAPGALMIAWAMTASGGCTESEEALVPVTGHVLVDGKPATGAAIAFHSTDSANGTHPVAQVDANGDFELTTIRSGDGARPGDYHVTLTWYVSPPARRAWKERKARPGT
jgi:hypothetical protein